MKTFIEDGERIIKVYSMFSDAQKRYVVTAEIKTCDFSYAHRIYTKEVVFSDKKKAERKLMLWNAIKNLQIGESEARKS